MSFSKNVHIKVFYSKNIFQLKSKQMCKSKVYLSTITLDYRTFIITLTCSISKREVNNVQAISASGIFHSTVTFLERDIRLSSTGQKGKNLSVQKLKVRGRVNVGSGNATNRFFMQLLK